MVLTYLSRNIPVSTPAGLMMFKRLFHILSQLVNRYRWRLHQINRETDLITKRIQKDAIHAVIFLQGKLDTCTLLFLIYIWVLMQRFGFCIQKILCLRYTMSNQQYSRLITLPNSRITNPLYIFKVTSTAQQRSFVKNSVVRMRQTKCLQKWKVISLPVR